MEYGEAFAIDGVQKAIKKDAEEEKIHMNRAIRKDFTKKDGYDFLQKPDAAEDTGITEKSKLIGHLDNQILPARPQIQAKYDSTVSETTVRSTYAEMKQRINPG